MKMGVKCKLNIDAEVKEIKLEKKRRKKRVAGTFSPSLFFPVHSSAENMNMAGVYAVYANKLSLK